MLAARGLEGLIRNGGRMRLLVGCTLDQPEVDAIDRLADQHGFVVLYPDGYRRNWNDCRKHATFPAKLQNIDDIGFIRTLIARLFDLIGEPPQDPLLLFSVLYSFWVANYAAFRRSASAYCALDRRSIPECPGPRASATRRSRCR